MSIPRTLRFWLGLGVGIVLASGVGVAVAAIPDAAGQIHTCYQVDTSGDISNGSIRLIDPASSKPQNQACKNNERPLDWDAHAGATGPQGPAGATGATGPQGATGPAGPGSTVYHASIYLNGIPSVVGNSPEFTGATRIDTGLYNVRFSVNVSRCGRVATLGIPSDQQNNSAFFKGFKGEISTFYDLANSALAVATFDSAGTPVDQDFQVMVVC